MGAQSNLKNSARLYRSALRDLHKGISLLGDSLQEVVDSSEATLKELKAKEQKPLTYLEQRVAMIREANGEPSPF